MPVKQKHHRITVQNDTDITSVWAIPDQFAPGQTDAIILAHGAGNDMNHPFMCYFHEALAEAGLLSIKFNFPYTEQGRKAPDRPALLMQTWVAIANAVANDDNWRPRRLFLGGKSMGGRMASMAVAQGLPCDGLIFLGYPLHPPKQPEKTRTEHWPTIYCPLLFLEGTRDTLCNLELLKSLLPQLAGPSALKIIEGGDHSFKVPKSLGLPQETVFQAMVSMIFHWIRHLTPYSTPFRPGNSSKIMHRFPVQSLNERRYAETFAVFLARSQEYPLMIEHLTSVIQSRPPGIHLLDVGAGTGFPIRELLTHSGITLGAYVGIEPNPDQADTLKTALASLPLGRFNVITEAFNPVTSMPGEFDLVLFSHSLYGMADPVGCFLHGATFLKADGLALAYLQGPYGDYAFYKLFEPLFDRDRPSLENGMSSYELLMGLRDRGAQPTVRFLPATIDLTGLFDPEQSHQLSELLSFCLLLEFESVPAPLRDDIIQYLRAACFERDGKLLWHVPTAAVTLSAGSISLTTA